MPAIYLTPASISYLTQLILSLAITVFLAHRLGAGNRQLVLLTCFFAATTVFIGLMFLDAALSPFLRLLAVYAQNSVLALALIFLLLFAYRFPQPFPHHKWESYAGLLFSLAYFLWEAGFMVYRYVALLGQGMVYYRPLFAPYLMALVMLLAPIAFIRQTIAADPRPSGWLPKLWKPEGKEARGARDMVVVFGLLFLLGLFNVALMFGLPHYLYNAALSVGVLAALWLFATTYINFIPGGVGVQTKLSVLTLTLFLALLGSVGWFIAPPYIRTFQPNLTDHQTLRFTPRKTGGYTVEEVAFAFESELGERLGIPHGYEWNNYKIDFDFPFYGQLYRQIYVSSYGAIVLGQPFWEPNMQACCAGFPAIFPLLIDLDPNPRPEGSEDSGVYARLDGPAERLIITWNHLPAFYQPQARFTFQASLYGDGAFEMSTNGLPRPFVFDPDASPRASPWLRGIVSGQGEPLHVNADDLLATAQTVRSPLIEDYHLAFRRYLHAFMLPLALIVIGGSLLLSLGVPLLLRLSIVRPLESLAAGVRQMEAGDLTVNLPIQNEDEIGYLTGAFNVMARRLGDLVRNLEARVAARTADLEHARALAEERGQAAEEARAAAEAANRAKSIFLANMSHELRTPLNAILGFSQLMSRSPALPPDQRDNLEIITTSGEHLLTLINQVLDLSKIEAGKMSLEEKDFDLYHLLDDLESMFQLRAAAKNLQLVFDRAVDVPQYIHTDELKLRQVLINLLNNAMKFTKDGSVTCQVSPVKYQVSGELPNVTRDTEQLDTNESDTCTLRFAVSDTGPGIAPAELGQLFEAFSQTQTGLQAREGTGLGLAICRHFVQLLGGEIGVESELGQGATFTFAIPASLAAGEEVLTQTARRLRRVAGLAPGQPLYRLLVVDDRWDNRQLLVKLLAPFGFDLQEAENGQAALDIWQAWQPHLIWLDMRMPVLDGWETARRIKATPQGRQTVVVAVTASAFEKGRARGLSAGCDHFIRKPLREADIFDTLEQYLGVQFLYEEGPPDRPAEDGYGPTEELAAVLQTLPPAWLAALEKAVIVVDMEGIAELAAQIDGSQPTLAAKLTALANDFEFKKISALIEAARKSE